MSAREHEPEWNADARENLRDTLRWVIQGELRLAKRSREEILETCREVYIEDECPESEWDAFNQFAAEEHASAASGLASEMNSWPQETDCDRLDRVEIALRERGILLWQASPCCDTCTRGELSDRIEVVNGRFPGLSEDLCGYAFFIDQNLPETLADSTTISLYLGYGWIGPNDFEVAQEVYEKNALGIAHEVCDCLRDEGFEVDWDGTISRKIGLSIDWRRRTKLV